METFERPPSALNHGRRTSLSSSHQPSAPPPGAGLRLLKLGIGLSAILAILAVVGIWTRHREQSVLAGRTRAAAVRTVALVRPTLGAPADSTPLQAEVRPFVEAPIYARASGFVKSWTSDIGARVSEGQLLAVLDTPELDQQLSQSLAQLAQSEAARDLAQTTANRWTDLLKTESVSAQEAEEKQSDLRLKVATVEAERANVRRLEDLKQFARITAPFPGTVTARDIDIGDLVTTAGNRPMFRLAQVNRLRVFVRVPQTLAASISIGQPAELSFLESPGKVWKTQVTRTAGSIDPASRSLLVELDLDNERGDILAGAYAQARFPTAVPAGALMVPSNCLIFRSAGPQVAVVNASQKVELRSVTMGRDLSTKLEILAGLKAEDDVILNPPDSLVEGETVRAMTEGGSK